MTPATDWTETVAADEAERFERYGLEFRAMQQARAKRRQRVDRGLHAKPNLCMRATFVVDADLPAHARVGIFAQPGSYDALVRFSNGTGDRQPDRKPDVRGVAVKLLGVPGTKLIPGMEAATTQDFLLIRTRSTPLRDVDEFLALVRAAATPALLLWKLIAALGLSRGLKLVSELVKSLKTPMTPLAQTAYYSALPMRWGAFAARVALLPADAVADAPAEDLGAQLAERLQRGPVRYDFAAQFYVDAERTPIEDASVDWDEAVAPHVKLGSLTLAAGTPSEALQAFVEALSFDPWHAPVEFRPLGNMMRARNVVYRHSGQERGAAGEPTSADVPA